MSLRALNVISRLCLAAGFSIALVSLSLLAFAEKAGVNPFQSKGPVPYMAIEGQPLVASSAEGQLAKTLLKAELRDIAAFEGGDTNKALEAVSYAKIDVNQDGKPERFYHIGSSYFGQAGAAVLMQWQDNGKGWQRILDVSNGTLSGVLPGKQNGYTDLLLGGPGMDAPIWRWNGKQYDFFQKVPYDRLKQVSQF